MQKLRYSEWNFRLYGSKILLSQCCTLILVLSTFVTRCFVYMRNSLQVLASVTEYTVAITKCTLTGIKELGLTGKRNYSRRVTGMLSEQVLGRVAAIR